MPSQKSIHAQHRISKGIALCILMTMSFAREPLSQITEIGGPVGSEAFGSKITVLPNGNFVVIDPLFDSGGIKDVGAIHLYNGSTRALISTLKGSQVNDNVGDGGVFVLANGNYVVLSILWDGSSKTDVGAATLCSANTGLSGTISESNSLVGSNTYDFSSSKIYALANGNYFVHNSYYDNGSSLDAGSITWGSETLGVVGVISTNNSLMGSSAFDRIGASYLYGNSAFYELANGNVVITSYAWNNGLIPDAGAVTWLSGTSPTTGLVSASNSLIGSVTSDKVGQNKIIVLANSNYVVVSPSWDNGSSINAGAVTWCNGLGGTFGEISSSNSLVGSGGSNYGAQAFPLKNGNYVASIKYWDNTTSSLISSITWANGLTGIMGTVSSSNSLIGAYSIQELTNGNYVALGSIWDSVTLDYVTTTTLCNSSLGKTGYINSSNSLLIDGDFDQVVVLTNGNYVIGSNKPISGTFTLTNSSTWVSGSTETVGRTNSTNSLRGTVSDDFAFQIVPLKNGNYVVINPYFIKSGSFDCGAVTWCDGTVGRTGSISTSNSLFGNYYDRVGSGGIVELSNGNYVVKSRYWGNGYGAVTWCSGVSGTIGLVNSTNSLVGSQYLDLIGEKVSALPNGNYIVFSPSWDNGSVDDVGAITHGNGTSGTKGLVSTSNSFVGTKENEQIDINDCNILDNGNYIVTILSSDVGGVSNAGSVTWVNGNTGFGGAITENNSLVGASAYEGFEVNTYPNSNYSIFAWGWDNGGHLNAGAVAFADGQTGLTGTINSCNSVLGKVTGGLSAKIYNGVYDYLLVGSAKSNFIRFKTLDKMPQIMAVTPANTCGNGDADLSVTASHGTVKWFTQATGGNPLYTGNTYQVSNLTTSKTYYAEVTDGTCLLEPRAAVNANVVAVISKVFDGSRCGSGTVNLSAQTSSGIINWYDSQTGGNLLSTGNSFTTPILTATTSYWIESVDGVCTTLSRKEVKAYILTDCITELAISSCGITLTNMEDAIYCNAIPGAGNYRYKVEHAASAYSTVSSREANDNLFRLSWLSFKPVKYGTTYDISVSVYVNGAWTAYGPTCQVTTPPTQLSKTSCGITLVNINDNIDCYEVSSATSYRFRVVNTEISFDQILEPAGGLNYGNLSTLPGIELGRTYTITAAAQVGGIWQNYGKPCNVSVPFTTRLAAGSCNISIPSISTALYSEPHPGATNYRYEIRIAATNSYIWSGAVENSNTLFRLSWLRAIPAEYNTIYSIRVAAFANGIWTAFGPPCTVATPVGMMKQEEVTQYWIDGEEFSLDIFPNPNQGRFSIKTNIEGMLSVRNELGQEIRSQQVLPENNLEVSFNDLSPGVYFISAISRDKVITQKVVVQ